MAREEVGAADVGERLCRAFEAAWAAAEAPRIEGFLGQVPAGERAALFAELLHIEQAGRAGRGETPDA